MEADLLVKIGVVVATLWLLWVWADWSRYRRRALRVLRALHLAQPAPPIPSGAPIERIAADARRIRAEIQRAPKGIPIAKLRGWYEAYDDVLVAGCRALDLEQRLTELPAGPEHDLERERVERLLERTGLLLRRSA
jgi:hypothetical protein